MYDKRFRMDRIARYALVISLAPHRLRIACIDPADNRCMGLENYLCHLTLEDPSTLTKLEAFFRNHTLLQKTSWATVVMGFENQEYTLVPTALFEARIRTNYLQLAVGKTTATVTYCKDLEADTTVVFGVSSWLLDWLQAYYGIERCWIVHQANMMVAMHQAYLDRIDPTQRPHSSVMAHTEAAHIHISIIQAGKLSYYNRFSCKAPEDWLHYLHMVTHHLSPTLSRPTGIIMGSIGADKLRYKQVQSYFPTTSLVTQPLHELKVQGDFKKSLLSQNLDIVNFLSATNYLTTVRANYGKAFA